MKPSNRTEVGEITWPEYQELIEAGTPIVIPIGSTEQHGTHLPLSTDTLLAQGISRMVAAEIGGLVAPPIAYGYRSHARTGGGDAFPGTANLDAATFTGLVLNVVSEFLRHGVQRILLINTHYENEWFIREACTRIPTALLNGARVVFINPWDVTDRAVLASIHGGRENLDPDVQHAGWVETVMALRLFPDLVQMEKVASPGNATRKAYDVYPVDDARPSTSGSLSAVGQATGEQGRALVAHRVERIVEIVRREFSLP